MRIAIFTPILYPFHVDLLNESKKITDARLFTCGIYGNYPFSELLKHAEVLRCVNIAGDKMIEPSSLARFINYKPNAVVIFGIEGLAGITIYFLSRLLKARTLVIVEENYVTILSGILRLLQGIKRSIIKFIYRHAPILVAESIASKKYVLEVLHVKREKPIVVRVHGVNTRAFSKMTSLPKDQAKRLALKILDLQDESLVESLWCTFIGEPSYYKGIDVLIDAIEILDKNTSKLKVKPLFLLPKMKLLRDKKELRAQYEKKLADLVARKLVVLYKHVKLEEIPLLYRATDIVVLPSRLLNNASSDRSPNVALEALASGTLIVASYVGGIPTIVGDAGVLVKPNDPHILAAALLQVMNNYEKYRYLAEKGRERAIRELDIRLYAYSLLKLLASMHKVIEEEL